MKISPVSFTSSYGEKFYSTVKKVEKDLSGAAKADKVDSRDMFYLNDIKSDLERLSVEVEGGLNRRYFWNKKK